MPVLVSVAVQMPLSVVVSLYISKGLMLSVQMTAAGDGAMVRWVVDARIGM